MKKRRLVLKLEHVVVFLMFFLLIVSSFSTIVTYADSPAQIEGEWIQASDGRWWYRHTDGTYTTDGWEYINGKWYHFDSSGWMQTGWLKVNSTWYYLSSSGAMCTGWQSLNNYWYYFTSSGAMCTGWQYINDHWYYFTSGGAMCTGWQYINGSWYYLETSGAMRTIPYYTSTRHYEFFSSGQLRLTQLNVTRRQQERSQWCWVASAVMVGTRHSGISISQGLVVYYVKGIEGNYPGTLPETVSALYYASNNEIYGTSTSIDNFPYSSAVAEIDDNQPFLIRMGWNSGGAHMVVGAGYDHEDNSIYIIDPYGNCLSEYFGYYRLITGCTINSGQGRWTHTIYY
ncbi:MAG: C39 family peptidase [Lachnospiraceae bacterium]|nr:C39 family peptidase [Lachnospiraceae bacterium]